MAVADFPLLDDERLSYPGHPNSTQLALLDSIADMDEERGLDEPFLLGWHYPTGGPMLQRGDGVWFSVTPTGGYVPLVDTGR